MKDALKNDRARIQVGRISGFGLMEMSRQRLRTGVLEASTRPCPHCEGTGLMRTASSAGLSALRMIEDEAARGRGNRDHAAREPGGGVLPAQQEAPRTGEIEERYGVTIEVAARRRARRRADGGRGSAARRRSHAPQLRRRSSMIEDDDDDDIFDEEDESRGRRGRGSRTSRAAAARARASADGEGDDR